MASELNKENDRNISNIPGPIAVVNTANGDAGNSKTADSPVCAGAGAGGGASSGGGPCPKSKLVYNI